MAPAQSFRTALAQGSGDFLVLFNLYYQIYGTQILHRHNFSVGIF